MKNKYENKLDSDVLIFIEYDDGIYRWVNESEAKKLEKQDKRTLQLLFKIPKGAFICYLAAFYIPIQVSASSLKGNLRSNNSYQSQCIEKVENEPNKNTFDNYDSSDVSIGQIFDYRPASVKNKKSSQKSFVKFAGTPGGSSDSSLFLNKKNQNFINQEKRLEKGKVLNEGKINEKESLVLSSSSSSSFIKKKSYSNTLTLSSQKNKSYVTSSSNFINKKNNDSLKKELKQVIQQRNELLKNLRKQLKESNKKIIIRELTTFKENVFLDIRGGFIPGVGLPFTKEILNWAVKKAQTILSNEENKEKQEEKQSSTRKNLIKLFDITNPITLIGLSIVAFVISRNKKGKEKLEELSDNIQEAIGIKKKKNIKDIVSDTLYGLLSFYQKRPFLFILTAIFIWKRKLVFRLINDKDTRNEFTAQAFQTINAQAEAIIKAKDKTVEITNSWMATFYKQMQRYTDQSLERISELRKQVIELQQTIKEKDSQILNDALAKQRGDMLLDQCNNEYQHTWNQNQQLYDHYTAQRNYNEKVQKVLPPTQNLDALKLPGVDPMSIKDLVKATAELKTGGDVFINSDKKDFRKPEITPTKEVSGKGKK